MNLGHIALGILGVGAAYVLLRKPAAASDSSSSDDKNASVNPLSLIPKNALPYASGGSDGSFNYYVPGKLDASRPEMWAPSQTAPSVGASTYAVLDQHWKSISENASGGGTRSIPIAVQVEAYDPADASFTVRAIESLDASTDGLAGPLIPLPKGVQWKVSSGQDFGTPTQSWRAAFKYRT